MAHIQIKDRRIGDGHPCYIIAEMSANHGGELSRALEIVRAAKESGADCVKTQTYTADTITMDSDGECFKLNEGLWKGETLYSLYKKAYTPWEWQAEIKAETERLGMDFLSTPFDATAVDFLEGIGVEFYKISSFEIVDIPLLRRVAATGKPIILSTGMASEEEIAHAASVIGQFAPAGGGRRGAEADSGGGADGYGVGAAVGSAGGAVGSAAVGCATGAGGGATDGCATGAGAGNLALLKCCSAYPAPIDGMNLRAIPYLRSAFQVPAGLSDHTIGSMAACTAVALGASVIEKHFCLSRGIPTPDAAFSAEPAEFLAMAERIREVEAALGKARFEPSSAGEAANRQNRKSIFVTKPVREGEAFTPDNIRVIRPGRGLEPKYYEQALGRRAASDIQPGTPLGAAHILGGLEL
ncbi:MAG: N-acetylneuraminate synthase family protein [Clostridiales bacterium]|jgi:N-acetylneuraminate synthase|nr:N-acetylneuraminate synthase family protein [Clostridiales bacterium]